MLVSGLLCKLKPCLNMPCLGQKLFFVWSVIDEENQSKTLTPWANVFITFMAIICDCV
jgi:hypothetical protein